jgi:hypothetical protein
MKQNYPYIDIVLFCTLGVMVLITCVISYVVHIHNGNFTYVTNEEDFPAALDVSSY